MVGHLLWPKWRMLLNAPRSADIGRGKALSFVVFGLGVWLSMLYASWWFLGRCLTVEPIGELLVGRILSLALMIVFSILLFSNVITTFSTFYLSDDLQLLMSRPIPPDALYTSRLLETAFLAGWMPLLFCLPPFVAAGLLFGASWVYYAALVAVLAPMVVIASALAVPLTLALTNALPAHRTRDVLIFLGVLVVVIVFIMFRAINPEELFNPDRFANTMELFASLQAPSSPLLPSTWAWEALSPLLRDEEGSPLRHLAGLTSTAAALYFIGAWSFRRFHFSGYTKAQEGRHAGSGLERAAGWMRGRRLTGPEAARRALARLSSRSGPLDTLQELVAKDGRVFIRDTAQWSQLVLLGALVVIYLLNFRYFRTMGEGGIIGPMGLFVLNIGLCGFVVAAVGVRFLFPAVSLEGRSFWLIKSSPLTMDSFLRAKWIAGGLPLLALSEVLTFLSNLMIGTPLALTLGGVVVMLAINAGISGLGIGLGALYPRFHVENAAKIASGFGGILYMMASLLLVTVTIALAFAPSWVVFHLTLDGSWGTDGRGLAIAAACLVGLLALPPLVGLLFVRLGARSLERR